MRGYNLRGEANPQTAPEAQIELLVDEALAYGRPYVDALFGMRF
jgi:hypothetical protein